MGNLGIAVSQNGYNVKDSADRLKVFSSAFQTLKIFNTYSITGIMPASGTNTVTIDHDLGFFAPYIVEYNGNTTRGLSESFLFEDGNEDELQTRNYSDKLEIDIIPVFDLGNITAGDTVYFTVYIFLDDFRTVSERNINTTTSIGNSSNNYGIRASKDGNDVKTCLDVDCSFSSSFFNQIIHKKDTVLNTDGEDIIVLHNLGYIPNFMHYTKSSGDNYIQYQKGGYITLTNLIMISSTGDTEYYIIFKDKLNE